MNYRESKLFQSSLCSIVLKMFLCNVLIVLKMLCFVLHCGRLCFTASSRSILPVIAPGHYRKQGAQTLPSISEHYKIFLNIIKRYKTFPNIIKRYKTFLNITGHRTCLFTDMSVRKLNITALKNVRAPLIHGQTRFSLREKVGKSFLTKATKSWCRFFPRVLITLLRMTRMKNGWNICWGNFAFFITALLIKVLYSLYNGQTGINNAFVYVKFM